MNVYVVTEGRAEASVYEQWIPLVNDKLRYIGNISNLQNDNFLIVSAMGYPYYFDVINAAIDDINQTPGFDRLVITVDSEEMTKQQKFNEISAFVSQRTCAAQIRIVVQHFCFETWALGNRKILRPNTASVRLREYKRILDIRKQDPELLPSKPDEGLNRSQFAEKYLRLALNDKFRNLTYTKSNPYAVAHGKYFSQVRNRAIETNHISSFHDFLGAFV